MTAPSASLSGFSVPTSAAAVDGRVAVLAGALLVAGIPAGVLARVFLRRLRRGARLPPPWCEAGVASAWGITGAAVAVGRVPARWLPLLLALGWFAVAAAAVDVAHRRLPDALTVPALPLALVLLGPLGPGAVLHGLAGAAVAVVAHAVLHLVSPAAMGAGDVKLAAPLGAVLAAASWEALVVAGLLAAVLTGGLAVVAMVGGTVRERGRGGRSRRPRCAAAGAPRCRGDPAPATGGPRGPALPGGRTLPHGPSMLAACWLVLIAPAGWC
jgi:leader peptidase (prepilin peptidase)/N-methyltransferase